MPSASAQVGSYQQWCQAGDIFANVSGITAQNPMQGSYPKCQVSVVFTGSTTPATIYSTITSTPLANPFCANADASFLFFASTIAQYDVTISNSSACNPVAGGYAQLPATFTFHDIGVSGSGGSSGTVTGTANQIVVTSSVISLSPSIIPPGTITFPVGPVTSSLVLGGTITNPCCALPGGSVWFNTVGPTGNGDITFYDNNEGYNSVITNLMTPAQLANGVTGAGATVLAASPVMTGNPNVANATGTSITLQSTTGDFLDLQSGTVTPYIQASPATGHIKCGYGSDNEYQCSYSGGPFLDMAQTTGGTQNTLARFGSLEQLVNSFFTDSGAIGAYTGVNGLYSPSYTTNGSGIGFVGYSQGTLSTSCNGGVNTLEADMITTLFVDCKNVSGTTYYPYIVEAQPFYDATGQATTLSPTLQAAAPAGSQWRFEVNVNQVSISSCTANAGNVGGVIVKVGYTDSAGLETLTAATLTFVTSGLAAASGTVPLRVNSTNNILMSATYTNCTGGTGEYDIHAWLERVK
jgi:hypothetical protein